MLYALIPRRTPRKAQPMARRHDPQPTLPSVGAHSLYAHMSPEVLRYCIADYQRHIALCQAALANQQARSA